jgi:predicted nucleotidyltransferase
MRLKKAERNNLKNSIYNFDKEAKLYLFGSRAKPETRGGDIDILIISEKIGRTEKRKIRIDFFREFGEQKLDLIVEKSLKTLSAFSREIFEKAVEI